MAHHRSTLRTLLVETLGRLLAMVGFLFVVIGLFGTLASVVEYGWDDTLFEGKSVALLFLAPAGIVLLKWTYPYAGRRPSSRV